MLASFSSQHLESHLHDPGNPLYDSITKNDALISLRPLRRMLGLVPTAVARGTAFFPNQELRYLKEWASLI